MRPQRNFNRRLGRPCPEPCNLAAFRFLAAVFLLVAVIALVTDLTGPLSAGQPFTATTVEAQWREMAPATLQSSRAAVVRSTAPWVWDGIIGPVLSLPTFLLFGLLALLCGYIGRRRRKVSIFVN
jgi:hypothetical protein